jgi:adenylate cyclase
MPARIRLITEDGAPPQEFLIGNTATIGRTPENTICLASNARVSRQHSLIRCFNGVQYQVMDLGSRNGTYVGEHRVVTPVTLDPRCVIRVSGTELHFESIDPGDLEKGGIDDVTIATTNVGTGSSTQRVAILVCDIRGFSTVAETMTPDNLARALGGWFAESGNAVTQSGGTIDKFIGDAILAYWPESQNEATRGAECATALGVAEKFLSATRLRVWPGTTVPFRVGVALHFGTVTCGNIGLVAQRDATIIGDAVNTAFRLESVMKELKQDLILSQDFATVLNPPRELVDLGERELKGKNQPVRVFALADLDTTRSGTVRQ